MALAETAVSPGGVEPLPAVCEASWGRMEAGACEGAWFCEEWYRLSWETCGESLFSGGWTWPEVCGKKRDWAVVESKSGVSTYLDLGRRKGDTGCPARGTALALVERRGIGLAQSVNWSVCRIENQTYARCRCAKAGEQASLESRTGCSDFHRNDAEAHIAAVGSVELMGSSVERLIQHEQYERDV